MVIFIKWILIDRFFVRVKKMKLVTVKSMRIQKLAKTKILKRTRRKRLSAKKPKPKVRQIFFFEKCRRSSNDLIVFLARYHRTHNSAKLLSRSKLIHFFRHFHEQQGTSLNKDIVTIGLVGYPNVGKSSTINALLTFKKVSVSATPGKTKHFQVKIVLVC